MNIKEVALPWMDRLRARLKDNHRGKAFKDYKVVMEFLRPVMEYGNKEEKRIYQDYKKRCKRWSVSCARKS